MKGYASVVEWDARTTSGWAAQVEGAHAVVNLVGENVGAGRWTASKKMSILQSRTNSANAIVEGIEGARNKPTVVVQASAVGYYGSRGDETLEEDSPAGSGLLAEVCRKVESIAARVGRQNVRHVQLRSGLVLAREGGVLPRMMQPFRVFLGGYVGSGGQWLSWISLRDEVRAIRFLIEQQSQQGAFDLTAPGPVTMRQFSRTLGQILRRPAWTMVPGFIVRLAFGQMADEVLLASQKAVPKRLLEAGFEFKDPDLRTALNAVIQGDDDESG